MIIRKSDAFPTDVAGSRPRREVRLGEMGGLTGLGINIVHLEPGQASSDRHWHLHSDEFCLVLSGEATLYDDAGSHTLCEGDAACWPAGAENAHTLVNETSETIHVLVAGTNPAVDEVRYPDSEQTLFHGPETWKLVSDSGKTLREGPLK
ncbi:MAG: cupin domain-containing protein [Pseudomonadota bacterium]